MNISVSTLNGIVLLVVIAAIIFFSSSAWAERPHHDHTVVPAPAPVIIYVTDADTSTSNAASADTQTITEVVNTTNIENYTPDNCQGVAIAQAGANNQMYMGTDKPQLSLGVGECNSDLATSLMFGMKVNKNFMVNGSWATDKDINGFGVGATVIFK